METQDDELGDGTWKSRIASFVRRLFLSLASFVAALAIGWMVIVAGAIFLQSVVVYGSFEYRSHALAVFTTTGAKNYGFVHIQSGETVTSIVLEPKEWDTLVELWSNARSEQSPVWRPVGEIAETDTFDNTRLSLLSGPGVRFVLHENSACADYVLPAADAERFERSIRNAQNRLHGEAAPGGLEIRPPTLFDKLQIAIASVLKGPRAHPVPSPSNCR